MRLTLVVLALSAAIAASHQAIACTQQEAMAKSSELSQLVQAKMAKNPADGQAFMMKMQPIMQANQSKMMSGGAMDWDAVCSQYDEMLKQAR